MKAARSQCQKTSINLSEPDLSEKKRFENLVLHKWIYHAQKGFLFCLLVKGSKFMLSLVEIEMFQI